MLEAIVATVLGVVLTALVACIAYAFRLAFDAGQLIASLTGRVENCEARLDHIETSRA